MKNYLVIFLACICFLGCIKSSQYTTNSIYNDKINSLTLSFNNDSLPADGNSKDTINIYILKGDEKDSINITMLNLVATTSDGTFTNNNMQTINLTPSYKLDSLNRLNLFAQLILQSSTKKTSALLKFTFAGVEIDTVIYFYTVYPNKIKVTASSLSISPSFKTEDSIYVQLSCKIGTPTSGDSVQLLAYDSTFTNKLGQFRISNNKSNSTGQCYFIYVLGDSTINNVNYTGHLNLIGITSNGVLPIKDTLQIYSNK